MQTIIHSFLSFFCVSLPLLNHLISTLFSHLSSLISLPLLLFSHLSSLTSLLLFFSHVSLLSCISSLTSRLFSHISSLLSCLVSSLTCSLLFHISSCSLYSLINTQTQTAETGWKQHGEPINQINHCIHISGTTMSPPAISNSTT